MMKNKFNLLNEYPSALYPVSSKKREFRTNSYEPSHDVGRKIDELFLEWTSIPNVRRFLDSMISGNSAAQLARRGKLQEKILEESFLLEKQAAQEKNSFVALSMKKSIPKSPFPSSINSVKQDIEQLYDFEPENIDEKSKPSIIRNFDQNTSILPHISIFQKGKIKPEDIPESDEIDRCKQLFIDISKKKVIENSGDSLSLKSLKLEILGDDFLQISPILKICSCLVPILYHRIIIFFETTKRTSIGLKEGITSSYKKPITWSMFEEYYMKELSEYDHNMRCFRLIKSPENNTIQKKDFIIPISFLLSNHKGLSFLMESPEFQLRYIETVIVRIFYTNDKTKNMELSDVEFASSNIRQVLLQLDEEEDVNNIYHYFSYEHFYVLYCRFWELDLDRDHLIGIDDLLRYSEHSLSYRAMKPIFEEIPRPFVSPQAHKMCYEDFIWFCLSEEDKNTNSSIEYWFRVMDLDGSGYITKYDMEYFFEEQTRRLELLGVPDPVPFQDVYIQLIDMVNPKIKERITLADLKRSKNAGIFFNSFLNVSKFLWQEQKEILNIRHRSEPEYSDWNLFATSEYDSLIKNDE